MTDTNTLAQLVAAVEAETDPGWDCNSYHPSLWPALKAARAALASAAQPAEAVAYGLEAWVDGAWHLQWPLRPTEADAEKDRAMYSADAKLRLVRLSAAAPKAAPVAHGDALDAARYRYLKKYKTWDSTDVFYWLRCAPADEVDSIIDAARAQAQKDSND